MGPARKIVKCSQRRHLGGWGRRSPKETEKKKKRKEKKKKEKEKRKKRKRKKGTMNSVKLLHIKCSFFQFLNSPVALKNKKNFGPSRKCWNDAPECSTNISELLKYFRFHYFDNNRNNKILIKSEWVSHLPLHLYCFITVA